MWWTVASLVLAVSATGLVVATPVTYPTPVAQPSTFSLYYSSVAHNEGRNEFKGGLYAGTVDPQEHGQANNMTEHLLECFRSNPFLIRQDRLHSQGISYDSSYDRILLHLMHTEGRTSVFVLPRCFHHDMCNNKIVKDNEYYQAKTLFSYGLTTDYIDPTCDTILRPFGLFNYQTYFIAKRVVSVENRYSNIPFAVPVVDSNRTTALRIELRRMARCNFKTFHSLYPYNVDECSFIVAVLLEKDKDQCDFYNLANHLLIMDDATGETIFLAQLFRREATAFYVDLLYMKKGANTTVLHTSELPYHYYMITDRGQHLGGISYKDGKLCWSAVTEIFCASWDTVGALDDVTLMLKQGQAIDASVCKGGTGSDSEILSTITTGVEIAEVDAQRGISLFFGCEQQSGNGGGAGLLQMWPDTGASIVYTLRDYNSHIQAGSMFLAETCPPIVTASRAACTASSINIILVLSVVACTWLVYP